MNHIDCIKILNNVQIFFIKQMFFEEHHKTKTDLLQWSKQTTGDTMEKIINISRSRMDEAIETLSLAVEDDPIKIFYFPLKAQRAKGTRWMVRKVFKVAIENGVALAHGLEVNGKIVATSLWIPPGKELSFWSLARSGVLAIPFLFGWSAALQVIKSMLVSDPHHKRHTGNKPHWYLFYIGVHPDYQRKGYGSKLLRVVLDLADKEKHPCFLQNETDANQAFYEANGFRVMERHVFRDDVIMRSMVRQPGARYLSSKTTKPKKGTGKKQPDQNKRKTDKKPSKSTATKGTKATTTKTPKSDTSKKPKGKSVIKKAAAKGTKVAPAKGKKAALAKGKKVAPTKGKKATPTKTGKTTPAVRKKVEKQGTKKKISSKNIKKK